MSVSTNGFPVPGLLPRRRRRRRRRRRKRGLKCPVVN